MKLERKYLIVALIAIVLAIPVTMALHHKGSLLKIEKSKTKNLQLKVNSQQKQLQLKGSQFEQEKQKNTDLQKQLQSKRDAAEKVAAAQAQAKATQTSAPVAVATGNGCEAYRGIIAQYSWNVTTALAVCNAESRGLATNDNPTDGHATCLGSRGLFQIGCDSTGGLSYASLFDPATNVARAFALYASRGWQPWGATTCAYKVVCV